MVSRRWLLRLVCALAAGLTGCKDGPSPTSGDATFEGLALTTVLADVVRDDGMRLIAGIAARGDREDLVVAAVDDVGVRLLSRSPTSYGGEGCRAEVAPVLVPGGASIVASCRTGGTNGLGYVAVVGVADAVPQVLMEVSCSVTEFELDGTSLRIVSEGEKPGSALPGAEQPDQVLTWDPVVGLEPDDRSTFDRLCATGTDRYSGPG